MAELANLTVPYCSTYCLLPLSHILSFVKLTLQTAFCSFLMIKNLCVCVWVSLSQTNYLKKKCLKCHKNDNDKQKNNVTIKPDVT